MAAPYPPPSAPASAPAPLPEPADGNLTGPQHDRLTWLQTILAAVFVVVGLAYLGWRATTFNPDAPILSGIVYGAEVLGFLASLLMLFITARLSVREPPPSNPDLLVDVIVSARDESVTTVRRTLVAAARMRYPHATWLADQTGRADLAELARELNVLYVSAVQDRATGKRSDAMAGVLKRACGALVAVLAADHTPSRTFLERTLGYFRDPRVGLVSTPLAAYNVDSFEHVQGDRRSVWSEQTLFNRVIQRGRDAWNAATSGGSAVVFRRGALNDIGATPEIARGEDLDTSLRMHRKGWLTVYHAEPLAFCLATTDFVPYVQQRTRLGQQAIAALRRHASALTGGELTWAQKACYLGGALGQLEGWRKLVFYTAPFASLLTGHAPVAAITVPLVVLFVLYYGLNFWVHEESSRGYGRAFETERYRMARLSASLLAVRGLMKSTDWKRVWKSSPGRSSRSQRFRYLIPQSGVLAMNALAIPVGLAQSYSGGTVANAGTLAMSAVWALGNMVLAQTVIGLTRRAASCRRQDYRFPIALPAMLNHRGTRPCAGVVDDVSATGFRYYGVLPRELGPGEFVTGQILLPNGPQPFIAEVHTASGRGADRRPRSIGCSFLWPTPGSGDELLGFLYGSDLQWRLNQFVEKSLTPIQRMARFLGHGPRGRESGQEYWAAATCQTLDGISTMHPGIITVPRNSRRDRTLVAFRRLLAKLPLRLTVTSRTGVRHMNGHAELFDAFHANGSPLYAYRFRPYVDPGQAPVRHPPPGPEPSLGPWTRRGSHLGRGKR